MMAAMSRAAMPSAREKPGEQDDGAGNRHPDEGREVGEDVLKAPSTLRLWRFAFDTETASCFARLAAADLARGRRLRRHDTWIAATALRHGASVVTQDADFSSFEDVVVHRV